MVTREKKKAKAWNGGPLHAFPLEEKDDEQRYTISYCIPKKTKTHYKYLPKGRNFSKSHPTLPRTKEHITHCVLGFMDYN